MADKNMKQSGWRVKLKDIGSSLYAIAVSVESNSTNTIYISNGSNNVSSTLTRSNDTTAYAANDVFGEATASVLSFSSICNNNESGFVITGANIRIDINAVPSGMGQFRVHLYNAVPSAITDNLAYNLPSGDRSKYLGYVVCNTPKDLGDTILSQNDNINFKSECAASTNTIYGIVETLNAFTPSANDVLTVTLKAVDV